MVTVYVLTAWVGLGVEERPPEKTAKGELFSPSWGRGVKRGSHGTTDWQAAQLIGMENGGFSAESLETGTL